MEYDHKKGQYAVTPETLGEIQERGLRWMSSYHRFAHRHYYMYLGTKTAGTLKRTGHCMYRIHLLWVPWMSWVYNVNLETAKMMVESALVCAAVGTRSWADIGERELTGLTWLESSVKASLDND